MENIIKIEYNWARMGLEEKECLENNKYILNEIFKNFVLNNDYDKIIVFNISVLNYLKCNFNIDAIEQRLKYSTILKFTDIPINEFTINFFNLNSDVIKEIVIDIPIRCIGDNDNNTIRLYNLDGSYKEIQLINFSYSKFYK